MGKRRNSLVLNNSSRHLWSLFLNNENNLGHASRELQGHDIDSHVNACWLSAQETVARVKKDIQPLHPKSILEVGASTGLNCYALGKLFDDAHVWGIEPETQAVEVAQSMKVADGMSPNIIEGVGENIPLPNESVDLILCHTVIEHVLDVPKVISEMNRVLAPGGIIHLEAPNYIWPFEPHLGVWCFPLLGKRFVKFCATMQGKGRMADFLNHLQFVHPFYLEELFNKHSLQYRNRSIDKIESVFSETADIKQYKKLAKLLIMLRTIGADRLVVKLLRTFRMYPSVLYTIRKLVS
jgi:ubiquinone/menaquinone biosynthesis C-methylase UbiE